jgi:hypothetical protein
MNQTLYNDALHFLTRYFNSFDKLELQSHTTLTIQEIVDILGYADSDVAFISDVRTLQKLCNDIHNQFYQ